MEIPTEIGKLVRTRGLSLSLLVRAGSKAHGIEIEGSDDDSSGVFTAPLREDLSIRGLASDTHAANGPDDTLHEFGKFVSKNCAGSPGAA